MSTLIGTYEFAAAREQEGNAPSRTSGRLFHSGDRVLLPPVRRDQRSATPLSTALSARHQASPALCPAAERT